ncbi:YhcH/YjgK/YiaL family protein [Conservatibacter flavescens]|uniref:YhcH/YjgK/YiaL family protein n=1 Tax=Conservatibacter flavescens TaxID=28161 RepID=A0A2M8RZC1_9PAST|nr:YhcH/YjgK/YiaL family protein [Conservatibacter flavescens]PJG84245.1 YhcH/YjgK/YiaL family protein [Conservatibacter flavescens]
MFFGHINQIDANIYPKVIQKALNYLKTTNFDELEVGRYELDGKNMYVQVLDLQTQEKSHYQPEVHRHYLDVQYLHSGKETIGVAIDNGQNDIAHDYDAERDILFYKDVQNETTLVMRPGNFAVFFPTDIHRAACCDGDSSLIRKVVVKIAVSQLHE